MANPGVLQALAAVLHRWTLAAFHTQHKREVQFWSRLAQNGDARRGLLLAVLPLITDHIYEFWWLCRGSLLTRESLTWLLEYLQEGRAPNQAAAAAKLASRVYDGTDASQTDAILEASRESQPLANEFSWLLTPVVLGSPEAKRIRDHWEAINNRTEPEQPPLLDPPPQERIAASLQEFAQGDIEAFWRLNYELMLEPRNCPIHQSEPDLTVTPGWKAADSAIRNRIVAAAKRYLAQCQPPPPHTWIAAITFPHSTLAGYRALLMLLQTEPGYVEKLPAEYWERWAPIVLAYPLSGEAPLEPRHQNLVKLAYQHAPGVALESVGRLIDKENEHGAWSLFLRVAPIWDTDLAALFLKRASDPNLKIGLWGAILAELLKHRVSQARKIAEDSLNMPVPQDGEQRSRAFVAAQALIRHTDDAGWNVVWPVIEQDAQFGLEVLGGIAYTETFFASCVKSLTDDQTARLYTWLVKHVPYREREFEGYGAVTHAQALGHWRDSVLAQLKNRGTAQALEGIRRAMQEFPELAFLKWHLMEAEEIARRSSWMPLEPKQFLDLVANNNRRVVQHGGQLLELLIESLHRLQLELQGETPAAFALWDGRRPKEEARLSDYVKLHFERDIKDRGIIVNREVQIRQAMGNKRGETTDIHVDAVAPQPDGNQDRISAIVEVKGCWNKELTTAMETQLTDRYLADNVSPYGLYLVGWFSCPQWDSTDYRKPDTPNITLGQMRAQLDAQAAQLSSGSAHIRAFVLNAALR